MAMEPPTMHGAPLVASVYQTQVAPVVLAVQLIAVVNHAHEHINIPEYTEHFRVYRDLGNQSATNAG